MTVAENVAVGAVARGATSTAWRRCWSRRGSRAVADRLAGTLAYGLQRRVEIARALAGGPSLLLLDEPAAGMNEAESDALLETIRGVRETGGLHDRHRRPRPAADHAPLRSHPRARGGADDRRGYARRGAGQPGGHRRLPRRRRRRERPRRAANGTRTRPKEGEDHEGTVEAGGCGRGRAAGGRRPRRAATTTKASETSAAAEASAEASARPRGERAAESARRRGRVRASRAQSRRRRPRAEEASSAAEEPAIEPVTLRIGFSGALEGPYAAYDATLLKGMEYAAKKINARPATRSRSRSSPRTTRATRRSRATTTQELHRRRDQGLRPDDGRSVRRAGLARSRRPAAS